jgi:hypothetical protein
LITNSPETAQSVQDAGFRFLRAWRENGGHLDLQKNADVPPAWDAAGVTGGSGKAVV